MAGVCNFSWTCSSVHSQNWPFRGCKSTWSSFLFLFYAHTHNWDLSPNKSDFFSLLETNISDHSSHTKQQRCLPVCQTNSLSTIDLWLYMPEEDAECQKPHHHTVRNIHLQSQHSGVWGRMIFEFMPAKTFLKTKQTKNPIHLYFTFSLSGVGVIEQSWDRVSYIIGYHWIPSIAKDDLELVLLLLFP